MRGGLLPSALGWAAAAAAVARAWAGGALETETEDRAPEDSFEECEPQKDIFQLVFATGEEKWIVTGQPVIAAFTSAGGADLKIPRGCERWDGKATCCRQELFENLGKQWNEEAKRFAAVRDAYTHLVQDVLDPAVKALERESQGDVAKRIAEVSTFIMDSEVGQAVVTYIDECEDPIRLHFAATTCELCNPKVGQLLLEGRYLKVDVASCTTLWERCRNTARDLKAMVGKLHRAAIKVEAPMDAGVRNQELAHAQRWLRHAAKQTEYFGKKVEFYEDEKEFCRRLQDRGYRYDPKDWGNLDLLHPSMAAVSESAEEDQWHAARGLPCVHGSLQGADCFCEPCWEGVHCERPAKPGPMREQPFRPLTADDVTGSQQPVALVGCRLPTDLEAQLARVKFVRVEQTGTGKESNLAEVEDPCPTQQAVVGDSFGELVLQSPVSATPVRLEYLIEVPQDSEGLFTVCFCQGPECLGTPHVWWRIGHVKVVRTDDQVKEEEVKEMKALQEDPMALHHHTGPPECDGHWRQLEMNSIDVVGPEDSVLFKCKHDFQDLLGPAGLKCVDGEWKVKMSEEDGSLTANATWDGQLPRCRWSHQKCGPLPGEHRMMGGGSVEVQDGVATYNCPLGSVMLADPTDLRLQPGQKVVLKAGSAAAVVTHRYDSSMVFYNVTLERHASDGQRFAVADSNQLWYVVEDGVFESYCQADGTWAPQKEVVCSETRRSGSPLAAVAVTSRGYPVSAGSRVEADSGSKAPAPSQRGAGNCGGSFGVPEVHAGEAQALVELLAQPRNGGKAPEASLLQLSGGHAEVIASDSIARPSTKRDPRHRNRARWRAMKKTRHAKGSPKLDIQKWRVQFTQDSANSFMVDRCWTTTDCSAPGVAPPDTAAALLPKPTTKDPKKGRHHSSISIFLTCGAFLALTAFFFVWTTWRSPQIAGDAQSEKRLLYSLFMG